jgi:hypothetical protein
MCRWISEALSSLGWRVGFLGKSAVGLQGRILEVSASCHKVAWRVAAPSSVPGITVSAMPKNSSHIRGVTMSNLPSINELARELYACDFRNNQIDWSDAGPEIQDLFRIMSSRAIDLICSTAKTT